jgi:hypothetical protein
LGRRKIACLDSAKLSQKSGPTKKWRAAWAKSAAHRSQRFRKAPRRLSAATNAGEYGLVLDQLRGCAQQGDLYQWRETLQRLESNWFAPLLAALKEGKIKRLTLTAFGEQRMHEVTMRRGALWRFWRHAKPLAALARD